MPRSMPVLIMAMLLLAACGDNDPTIPEPTPDALVFTRPDGSRVTFPAGAATYVWCGPWEVDVVPVPAVHVVYGLPGTSPFWMLQAVTSDIVLERALLFPNSFVWDQPQGALLFLLDDPNELSTAEGDASGTLVFHESPCDGGSVHFTISAVLGSESGGPPISVSGTLRATLNPPPF